jgi:hypothetical protein
VIDPRHMDKGDKQFFVNAIIIPMVVWWIWIGRKKYSAKGMK